MKLTDNRETSKTWNGSEPVFPAPEKFPGQGKGEPLEVTRDVDPGVFPETALLLNHPPEDPIGW